MAGRVESDQPLTVQMRNGDVYQGTVERFDRDVITLRPSDGPVLVLRKQDIRFLAE
jgi:sRNA-binding regulator protein Hfq